MHFSPIFSFDKFNFEPKHSFSKSFLKSKLPSLFSSPNIIFFLLRCFIFWNELTKFFKLIHTLFISHCCIFKFFTIFHFFFKKVPIFLCNDCLSLFENIFLDLVYFFLIFSFVHFSIFFFQIINSFFLSTIPMIFNIVINSSK